MDASIDGQVIDQLQKAGSRLDQPHDIEFFFYFPTEAQATRIGQMLADEEYSVHGS